MQMTVDPDEKAVAKQGSPLSDFLAQIQQVGDPSAIKELVALWNQQQDRQRREDFESHFLAMQKELAPVIKNKSATKDGKKIYSYAPLDVLENACRDVIHNHGFSYSWREESLPDSVKRTVLIISGWGWSRENYFDSPMIPGTNWQNAIQVAGAQSSYGRRYTFISGFGITIEGEDSDGAIPDDPEILATDLREYCAKTQGGVSVLLPETVKMIKDYLSKPADTWDVKKLKEWHKRARAKVGA